MLGRDFFCLKFCYAEGPPFGKLMNHGRLWRGGAAVAVVGELVEPQAMERVRAPRNPGTA